MEEFKDIIAGLEQRIHQYGTKLRDLQKRREKIEEDIKTTKKYLELAETLHRVEVEKAKMAIGSSASSGDGEKERRLDAQTEDRSRDILFEQTKYLGLSVPEATLLLLRRGGGPLHAKTIYQNLLEGGVRIRGKTPVTSVVSSISRDKRFKKVAPSTFQLAEESGMDSLIGERPVTRSGTK